jgi:hypothetical protein
MDAGVEGVRSTNKVCMTIECEERSSDYSGVLNVDPL